MMRISGLTGDVVIITDCGGWLSKVCQYRKRGSNSQKCGIKSIV